MINIPSSLQSAWDDVSKDGKIDKADVKKLIQAAAPGITQAKTAEDLDKALTTEIDKEERDFLSNFSSTENGSTMTVKNGSAKGTFEFVNSPDPVTSKKTDAATDGPIKLFEPLKLPGTTNTSSVNAPAPVSKTDETQTKTNTQQAITPGANPETVEKIKKLHILKDSLSKLLNEPELSAETKKIDTRITQLEDKALAEKYSNSKSALLNQIEVCVNTALVAAETDGNPAILADARKNVETLLEKYAAIDHDPAFKDLKAENKQAPAVETLKKGIMDHLQEAENKVKEANTLLGKASWNNDDKAKVESLQSELPSGNLKTKLAEKLKNPTETKTQPEIKNQEVNKTPEETEAAVQEKNKANMKTSLEGLHDVIGNGFWNKENKEGTGAMFQLITKQGLLDQTMKQMSVDDQKEAIKILSAGSNVFNHAIARKLYENLSRSANIDGDLDKNVLKSINASDPDVNNFEVETSQVYKGMEYSLYHEKEAAMTMARGIINQEISGSVLTKFSSRELNDLVKLVGKNGTKEEKEGLEKIIAKSYVSNKSTIKVDNLSKESKAKIVGEVLSSSGDDPEKMKSTVKQMGKDVIFEAVNNGKLTDAQLANLAKYTDGDDMADNVNAGAKLLLAMIKEYNKDPKGNISLDDINKFIDQVDNDWTSDDDVMKMLLRELSDGPDSEYAKFKALAPRTMDKIWKIAD